MPRIDDLIQDIYKEEAPDLPGFMDKEQQKRIEERIMAAIEAEQEKEQEEAIQENVTRISEKRRPKKRFFIFGLAAVMVLGLCISAFASSNPDWDIEIMQFMGLDDADTLQLESGEVEIKVYDEIDAIEYDAEGNQSIKEVKIMAANSIGDKNSACIRIETDYELPEGFDETTDYILPEHSSLNVYQKPGNFVGTPMGYTMGYINDNGKLGFMIYITGCKDLNKSQVDLSFKNFYLHHDLGLTEGGPEEELLLEGEWKLTWKYAYKSNINQYKMLKQIEIDNVKYYITNIEISPLSVQIDGFRFPWDREEPYGGFVVDEIRYKDGTVLNVGGFSSAGNSNGIWMDSFLGTTEMKTTIDVGNVESIVIGGNEIYLK